MSPDQGRKAFPARWREGHSSTPVVGKTACELVVPGPSKERSDAAQTLGSMPYPASAATVQNSGPSRPSANATAWILGSSPRMTNAKATSKQPSPLPLISQAPFPSAQASSNRSPTPHE
ncbi:MAG: hypothetical protein EKK31_34505 [Hyphomicrobiales bacterium]|nr:MAG: hypothetical protein EKK31_34505 [Hyphomicrobiales bacterium]